MSIALAYERNRLRKAGFDAEILDPAAETDQEGALVFDVSTPSLLERARSLCPNFEATIRRLQMDFGVSLEWPGFDILSLDPHRPELLDRIIELKSSGIQSRTQEMSWNEWKSARTSTLRPHFFLYLVGNLRSDLKGSTPFVRTVQDPFGQLAAEILVTRMTQRKVQLAVNLFREADHLDLTVVARAPVAKSTAAASPRDLVSAP